MSKTKEQIKKWDPLGSNYKTRMNKYKKDPFRPQPDLRISSKSRRHHPVTAGSDFCTKRYKRNKQNRLVKRCAGSPKKCDQCFLFSELKEIK